MNPISTCKARLPAGRHLLFLALACHLPTAIASETNAQPDVMEEVVVRADFRQISAQNLANSVSILSEQLIKENAAQHFDDLINTIPNLNFAGGTSRARFFQIRGIGERSQFGEPVNPSVGYIVDNVDFSGAGSIGTLLDVQQVEVLKGPQGTRYGANALAGLIFVKTNDPVQSQSLDLRLSAGEYNHRNIGAVLNQPLSETISARFAIEKHKSDGYYENEFLDTDDNNNRDETTARLKLLFDLNDNWQLLLGTSRVDIDNGYDVFTLDNNRSTRSDQPGKDVQTSNAYTLQSDWQSDFADAQLIVAHAESDIEYSYDEDWTYTGFHPDGYTSFDQYKRDKQITSFETRLISNEASRLFNDTTDWVLGFYNLRHREDVTRQYTFLANDFDSEYDFTSSAIFFQFDTAFGDQWLFSYGGRLESRDTDYDNSAGFVVATDEDLWGGRLSLKYFATDNTMAYLSVARGYKAGGFNTDGSLPNNLREFDSETLLEWELGIKSTLFENSLELSAAIFYDQRKDQQVKSSFVRPRQDGSTEFVDFLGNAAEGTNQGLELGVRWQILDSLSLTGNIALLNAEFDEFINEFGEDLSGRDQAQAPNNSFAVALNWQHQAWQANLSWIGKDEFYFSDRHNLKSTDYTLLNANISYALDKVTFRLWGRNLTDKDYTVRGFGSFGNDPRKGYITEPYVQFGEPKITGVTVEYKLGGST